MATRKSTTTRKSAEDGKPEGQPSEVPDSATAPFERAYYSYMTVVRSAGGDTDLQERISEAANDCLRTYYDNQLPQDVLQQMSEAWDGVSKSYGPDVEPAERLSTVQSANNTYAQLLEQAQQDRNDRVAAAYAHYAELMQQAPRAVAEQADRAFRDYVGELRNAWAAADADALQVEDLLAIGQSVVQVCAEHMLVKTVAPS